MTSSPFIHWSGTEYISVIDYQQKTHIFVFLNNREVYLFWIENFKPLNMNLREGINIILINVIATFIYSVL